MSKVEVPTAKRITSDWTSALPGFVAWRPLRLLRRIGPVVQGVTLDRTTSGDGYFPTVHIHALVREFPVVTLTLGQRLVTPSGVQESIPFALHSTEFVSAAQRLIAQSELSLEDPPSISEIVNALYGYVVVQQDKGFPPAVRELEDGILLAAAVGGRSLVEFGLDLARQMVAVWPKSRLPLDWQGGNVWLAGLEQRVDDSSGLKEVVERQVAFHKLAKVPDSQ